MIHNAEIAALLNKLANLLEIEGANSFRIRAYRNAARTIANISKSVAELVDENADLTELPYIGRDLAEKIKILVKTGKLPLLEELEEHTPNILNELLNIPHLGPKRVQAIYKALKIKTLEELKQAIAANKISRIKGFGNKIEQKIKEELCQVSKLGRRVKLVDAIAIAKPLKFYLEKIAGVSKVEIAGSFRRHQDTVGDIDILVIASKNAKVIENFIKYDEVAEIISQGSTRSTIRLRSGVQVDLRLMPAVSYGAALFYFTGSKAHNLAIRKIAIKKNLKVNEYGVFKNNKRIAGKTEVEVYKTVGLTYIEPELREDRGEIEAAQQNNLPKLIQITDIKGDLHCHTHATDGTASVAEMADVAAKLGYEYIAITDHSKHLTIANGMDKKRLWQQIKIIDELNGKLKNITILKAIEVDILEDGKLDLPNDILKELDLTVCSVHYKFNLNENKQTERIIRAMDNLYFNIFAHPTGRIINKREPYHIDLEKIMLAAKVRNCFLELNAQPERLDLNDTHCRMAREMGVKIVISSDAHHRSHLNLIEYGICQARRGWLGSEHVLNTYPLAVLKKNLKRK